VGTTGDWGGEGTIEEASLQALPKTVSDGADVTFCDRVFHSRKVTAIGKARLPVVERQVRWTSDDDEVECRR